MNYTANKTKRVFPMFQLLLLYELGVFENVAKFRPGKKKA